MIFERLFKLALPKGQSAFLWGARQTGKSTYLQSHFPESVWYNLLQSDIYLSFAKKPWLLREQVQALTAEQLALPIIIDEVQKVPELLDEVHWLIENAGAQFILCGSSARKLRREGANLLGGRGWRYHFYPLVTPEIPDFDLLRALNHGMVPSHYINERPQKALQAYIEDYLNEEIKLEGLVRNLPAFARFLDSLAFSHGEMTVYQNIASDCGVDSKTVQNYYQILVDTLLGYFLPPFRKRVSREIIQATPKFYLFDTGVANYLAKIQIQELRGTQAGASFEHFIFMELTAYNNIKEKNKDLFYWRTKSGLEVDFIIGSSRKAEVAVEAKISSMVEKQDLKGLIAFCEEHHPEKALVVSQDKSPRKIVINETTEILILPWKIFLERLWAGEIF